MMILNGCNIIYDMLCDPIKDAFLKEKTSKTPEEECYF